MTVEDIIDHDNHIYAALEPAVQYPASPHFRPSLALSLSLLFSFRALPYRTPSASLTLSLSSPPLPISPSPHIPLPHSLRPRHLFLFPSRPLALSPLSSLTRRPVGEPHGLIPTLRGRTLGGNTLKYFQVFPTKNDKPRSGSGRDWLMCSKFARQRLRRVSLQCENASRVRALGHGNSLRFPRLRRLMHSYYRGTSPIRRHPSS